MSNHTDNTMAEAQQINVNMGDDTIVLEGSLDLGNIFASRKRSGEHRQSRRHFGVGKMTVTGRVELPAHCLPQILEDAQESGDKLASWLVGDGPKCVTLWARAIAEAADIIRPSAQAFRKMDCESRIAEKEAHVASDIRIRKMEQEANAQPQQHQPEPEPVHAPMPQAQAPVQEDPKPFTVDELRERIKVMEKALDEVMAWKNANPYSSRVGDTYVVRQTLAELKQQLGDLCK